MLLGEKTMAELLTPRLILEMAVNIEKNGEAFYRNLANWADDPNVREIFSKLAAAEKKHQTDFSQLLSFATDDNIAETYPGEVADYIRALSREHVFVGDKTKFDHMKKASDDEAIRFAIGFEKDSILLYNELKSYVPKEHEGAVKELIKQEKSHVMLLSEVRRKIKEAAASSE